MSATCRPRLPRRVEEGPGAWRRSGEPLRADVRDPARQEVKTVSELKRNGKKGAEEIWFATDLDREGEAIAWHLAQILKIVDPTNAKRVVFNAITKDEIAHAFDNPHPIDEYKVNAQQARRILDRIVGYQVSPLLWRKVARGLSAGRVQSVAVRLVVEREREIDAFIPEEYWRVTARLTTNDSRAAELGPSWEEFISTIDSRGKTPTLKAQNAWLAEHEGFRTELVELNGESFKLRTGPEDPQDLSGTVADVADAVGLVDVSVESESNPDGKGPAKTLRTVKGTVDPNARYKVRNIETRETIGDAGTVGLITYMRTDSTRVSNEAIDSVREYIDKTYGKETLPEKPRQYKVSKQAQEAHEAIRPTSMDFPPSRVKPFLGRDEFRLYQLIWNRFVASQMASAIFDVTRVDIEAGPFTFRANGQVLKSPGFLAVYQEAADEDARRKEGEDEPEDGNDRRLPKLVEGQELNLQSLLPKQHFTQPPARFSEATLVKELEENGIGRPSTYASIISTITGRDYVEKDGRRFKPTELGFLVNDLMVASFGDIVDVGYTARMEQQLDRIEEGDLNWIDALRDFQKTFEIDLKRAKQEMRDVKREAIPTDQVCDKCGKQMVLKWGRFGQFLACSGYPECKNTRDLAGDDETPTDDRANMPAAAKAVKVKTQPNPVEENADPCEKCGKPMVLRRGRFGPFLACSGYPDCKTTRKITVNKDGTTEAKGDVLLDEECPKCKEKLALKQGRFGEFTACSNYPKCRYVKMKETGVTCPECGKGNIVERRSKRGKLFYGCGNYPDCTFVLWKRPVDKACPECDRTYLVERVTKKHGRQLICEAENCDHVETAVEA